MRKINTTTTILERVNQIERELQSLKVKYFLSLSEKERNRTGIYRDENIINELRKIRKTLWNERYSKAI
jgi:hypothetical protein